MCNDFTSGPWHLLAVCALVRNDLGEILLIKHKRRGWDIPGGQVEQGEDLIKALKRELQEETGVNICKPALAVVYSNLQPEAKSYGWVPPKLILCFVAQYAGGSLHTSAENSETLWVTGEQAGDMIKDPLLQDRLQDLLQFAGKVLYVAYIKQPYKRIVQTYVTAPIEV